MKKQQIFICYFGATMLAALLAAALLLCMRLQPTAAGVDSRANTASDRSYEAVVKDEQLHWGHGHTAGDSRILDPAVIGFADHAPKATYLMSK